MNTLFNSLFIGLTFSFLAILNVPVTADDITFTPRTSVTLSSYEFTQSARPNALSPSTINGGDFPEVKFEVTFKILGLGGTFFKSGYYLDLLVQQSMDEEDSFTLTDPAIPLPGNTFKETFEGDRQDASITFGRKFLDNRAGAYLGYKTGKSEASGNQGQHLSFKEKGFFIGANYAWRVKDNGVISVNLAYADLEGDLVEDVNHPLFASLPVPLDIDASSDATGLSYGVSWSSRISNDLSYSFGIDAKSYTFDDVSDKNPVTITSDEFKEEFLSMSLSLFFLF